MSFSPLPVITASAVARRPMMPSRDGAAQSGYGGGGGGFGENAGKAAGVAHRVEDVLVANVEHRAA